jgi:hypothetical protein
MLHNGKQGVKEDLGSPDVVGVYESGLRIN